MFLHFRRGLLNVAKLNRHRATSRLELNWTRKFSNRQASNQMNLPASSLMSQSINTQSNSIAQYHHHHHHHHRNPSTGLKFWRSMSYDNANKTHKKIKQLIEGSQKSVFVFMKGVPSEPSCRYSGIVVQILDAYGVDYDSADVLQDADIREEIKSYSDWPTIPQVFVDGAFVGGCDILLQMHESGELKSTFKLEDKPKEDTKPAEP